MKYNTTLKYKSIDKRTVIYENSQSFHYDMEEVLTTSLHCHSEYELIYIINGNGKEFVGDSVREYHAGDMVLIGKNVPHLYLADSDVENENLCSILQFPQDIFPEKLDEIQEYAVIGKLLEKSSQGIVFHSMHIKNAVLDTMDKLSKTSGIRRLLALIRLLDQLGRTNNVTLLSTLKYHNPMAAYRADDPLSKIYSYLINNHREEVTIELVAEYVHMNPTSLCRYYKQRTGKTIFQTLIEIRVEYACKLLSNTHLNISEITWRSGFNNQANFNKQFRLVTGLTPTEYRRTLVLT